MNEKAKPFNMSAKPPTPRYHYKLATVSGSQAASRMENALRKRLTEISMTYFAIGHEGGSYDVMGDSGGHALAVDSLQNALAVAAQIGEADSTREGRGHADQPSRCRGLPATRQHVLRAAFRQRSPVPDAPWP